MNLPSRGKTSSAGDFAFNLNDISVCGGSKVYTTGSLFWGRSFFQPVRSLFFFAENQMTIRLSWSRLAFETSFECADLSALWVRCDLSQRVVPLNTLCQVAASSRRRKSCDSRGPRRGSRAGLVDLPHCLHARTLGSRPAFDSMQRKGDEDHGPRYQRKPDGDAARCLLNSFNSNGKRLFLDGAPQFPNLNGNVAT